MGLQTIEGERHTRDPQASDRQLTTVYTPPPQLPSLRHSRSSTLLAWTATLTSTTTARGSSGRLKTGREGTEGSARGCRTIGRGA